MAVNVEIREWVKKIKKEEENEKKKEGMSEGKTT